MHVWVAIQYQPVEVTQNADGDFEVHTTELADEISRDEAAIGCWICEQDLDANTYNEECPGAPQK